MPAQSESFDVAVVGGGAIGLACAWRAQQRGARVVVIDAGEPGAWNVAAGMLAPVSEAEFGERELLAARAWRARAATRTSAPSWRTRATARPARWSSRATATRPRRSTASPRSGASSACRSSGCARRRRGASSRRWRRRSASRSTSRATTRSTRASSSPRSARAFTGEQRRGRVRGAARQGERVTGVHARRRRVDRRRRRSSSPPACTSRTWRCPTTRASRSGPVKGQVLRLRDPRGPGLVERTIRGEPALLRPARRRLVRPRRDDGGARLGHDADRRRRLRAAARPERARPRHLRARDRGAHRGPAPRDARQPARDRPRRARRAGLGHRPLPQRHPADAGHRRPRRRTRWPASRCRTSPPRPTRAASKECSA